MKFTRRVRFATLMTVAPLLPAALLWSHFHSAHQEGMRIEVSRSERELRVIRDGEVVHTYGIAVGRPSHPTPSGHFRSGDIDWNPQWVPPPTDWARNKHYEPPGAPSNPMQGVKIYFLAPYYFIHGTNNPGSIGSAASHGCIRMTEEDAVSLARRIQRNGGSALLIIRH